MKFVVSCSSEDSTHKAENLLVADSYRKWRCAHVGEKQISAILQFEKAESIHSIDIGNEGSAFVEVLVGNSTSACEQDFEVMLVSSFFMSPTESRSGSNLNRVRMFGPDKLAKAAVSKRWDRVKIICTQPYNKNLPYGLCFIRFNSPPEADEKIAGPSAPTVRMLGHFAVKDEDDGSGNTLKPGSLFLNRTPKPHGTPTSVTPSPVVREGGGGSYAVVALEAAAPSTVKKTPGPSPKEPPRTKRKFEFSKDPSEPSVKKLAPSKPAPKRQQAAPSTAAKGREGGGGDGSSPLTGCVLVFSGFQNPLRSTLRETAVKMGAVYRGNWADGCTHLVCAFANTPKYSQVKELGGAIVRKDWILDCDRTGKLLPYKRYLLDGPESSSDDDDEKGGVSPPSKSPPSTSKMPVSRVLVRGGEAEEMSSPSPRKTSPPNPREETPGSTDEEMIVGPHTPTGDDSGCDTEDEIKRVQDEMERGIAEDPYAASTDENTDIEEGGTEFPIPELPDLFEGKNFLLYGDFPDNEHRILTRYITAFNGALEDYMSETVNYVITAEEWDDRFDEALMENVTLAFVRPRWVYTCNERQRLVPHQPFVVVPTV